MNRIMVGEGKVQVMFTLEQASKAHSGGRGIVILFP